MFIHGDSIESFVLRKLGVCINETTYCRQGHVEDALGGHLRVEQDEAHYCNGNLEVLMDGIFRHIFSGLYEEIRDSYIRTYNE